jgi:glycerophosphoryl diester phosphodiesterase
MNDTAQRIPVVIAHRGASGYLPEHTLEAKALAYGMGADYLEQDVVASRDDELLVLHDIHLDTVTDVAERFSGRAREDGRFYARDFDLAELRTLNVHERRTADGITAVFPGRFPTAEGRFSLATLAEEITMIQGLNKATGRSVGIYPEVKSPAFHAGEGVDLSQLLLNLLREFGYTDKAAPVFVQCFDAKEVARLRNDLGCRLKLVQLIGENDWAESDTDYDALQTTAGLQQLATVADAIGPWAAQLYTIAEIDGQAVSTGLASRAHAAGLSVHPYTFRADALLPGFANFAEMIEWFAGTLSIDGLFTDFPDQAIEALAAIRN